MPSTVDDAKGVAKYLLDPARCGFEPGNVVLLTEKDASRGRILEALDALARDAIEDSTVIVYFSGHGAVVEHEDGNIHYLLTNGYDLKRRAATCIKGSEFAIKLSAIKASRLLLLLDCCLAGAFASSDENNDASEAKFKKAAIPTEVQEVMARGSGRWVIASSQNDEISLINKPYSLFTHALLQSLEGHGNSKKDGLVRVLDILQHCREKVPQWANQIIIKGQRQQQHPVGTIESSAGDFAVAYYAASNAKKGDFSALKGGLPDPDLKQAAELSAERMAGSMTATLTGDGAIAQGNNSVAVGSGGVHIDGNNSGNINTGTQISGDYVETKIEKHYHSTAPELSDITSEAARALVPLLNGYFSISDIDGLCFEMGIDDEQLRGQTKDEKSRSLVKFVAQTERLDELKRLMRAARPNLRKQLM
jgi:hypothetical protein